MNHAILELLSRLPSRRRLLCDEMLSFTQSKGMALELQSKALLGHAKSVCRQSHLLPFGQAKESEANALAALWPGAPSHQEGQRFLSCTDLYISTRSATSPKFGADGFFALAHGTSQ